MECSRSTATGDARDGFSDATTKAINVARAQCARFDASFIITRPRARVEWARRMRVHVVRHAQSENNALRAPGIDNPSRARDPGLTSVGEAQVAALRALFASFTARTSDDAGRRVKTYEVYTSPMRRAMLTARGVCLGTGGRARVRTDAHEHGGCFDGGRNGGGVVGRPGMTKREVEDEFGDVIDAPDSMAEGWWDPALGCETVAAAQARGKRVAEWLWEKARAQHSGEAERADIVLVSHGMFIDILLKTLFDAPRTTGKQSALFCSQNASVHKLHFDVSADGECVGLEVFNDVSHIAEKFRTGGSVDGLSEAYTNEGSA